MCSLFAIGLGFFFQILLAALPACMSVHDMDAWCQWSQKKGSDPLEEQSMHLSTSAISAVCLGTLGARCTFVIRMAPFPQLLGCQVWGTRSLLVLQKNPPDVQRPQKTRQEYWSGPFWHILTCQEGYDENHSNFTEPLTVQSHAISLGQGHCPDFWLFSILSDIPK